MKTKVRIQYSTGEYNLMHIQILNKRWKDSTSMESIGYLSFQKNIGEDKWYGLRFDVNTSEVRELEEMTKLARFIKKNSTYDTQPDAILKLIGAEEYMVYMNDFVPMSYVGKDIYNVFHKGGYYTRIYADTEKLAQKQLKKLKLVGAEMLFIGKVHLQKESVPV